TRLPHLLHPALAPCLAPERPRRSRDLREIAVPAESVLEPSRARDAIFDERLAAVVPFLNQRLAHRQAVALDRRAAIGAHAHLREAGDLMRQLLGLLPRAALRREVFAQADIQALLGRHLAPGENDLERAPLPDDTRQTHRSAVDQRHAPAA